MKIDKDLAQNMKDEIDGVKPKKDLEKEIKVDPEKSKPAKIMVDSSLLTQVERIKKVCIPSTAYIIYYISFPTMIFNVPDVQCGQS